MDNSCSNFYVGDRVQCLCDVSTTRGYIPKCATGTVQVADMEGDRVGVFWDDDVGGHSLSKSNPCTRGHGWYFFEGFLREPSIKLLEKINEDSFSESSEMSDFLEGLLD